MLTTDGGLIFVGGIIRQTHIFCFQPPSTSFITAIKHTPITSTDHGPAAPLQTTYKSITPAATCFNATKQIIEPLHLYARKPDDNLCHRKVPLLVPKCLVPDHWLRLAPTFWCRATSNTAKSSSSFGLHSFSGPGFAPAVSKYCSHTML